MTGDCHDHARYSVNWSADAEHPAGIQPTGCLEQEGEFLVLRLPDPDDGVKPSEDDLSAAAQNENWRDRAACYGLDPELFYPDQGPTAGETVRQAKKVCWNDCPVRQECEDYGVEHELRYGVFGGWTVRERRALRRLRDLPPGEQAETTEELTLDLGWDDDYLHTEVA